MARANKTFRAARRNIRRETRGIWYPEWPVTPARRGRYLDHRGAGKYTIAKLRDIRGTRGVGRPLKPTRLAAE